MKNVDPINDEHTIRFGGQFIIVLLTYFPYK